MPEPLLSVCRLTKRFGSVTAVLRTDLTVRQGDFTAIFGPNGAGKSTLLRMLAQLSHPSEGEIRFEKSWQGRASLGYVSHQSLLYNELSGLENLTFFARLYNLSDPVERSEAMLRKMSLWKARHQPARGYSSGMKQRLSLARALIHEPQLLLLDEPYAGLDQHGSRLLTELLQQLNAEGRTVLLITHNLGEGLSLCSRVVVMNRGQVVFREERGNLDAGDFENLYFRLVEA